MFWVDRKGNAGRSQLMIGQSQLMIGQSQLMIGQSETDDLLYWTLKQLNHVTNT